jgi:hypothetical protein
MNHLPLSAIAVLVTVTANPREGEEPPEAGR